MPDTPQLLADLERRLDHALQTCGAGPEPGLLSITLAAPEFHFDRLPPGLSDYVYWAHPETGHYLLGTGRAIAVEAAGVGRFDTLSAAFAQLSRRWRHYNPARLALAPRAFAGFAFNADQDETGIWADLPSALLFVPTLLLQRLRGDCALTFTAQWQEGMRLKDIREAWLAAAEWTLAALAAPAGPARCPAVLARIDDQPPAEEWLALVDAATTEIEAGGLQKVVLTRRIRVEAPRRLDPARLMQALHYRYPGCTHLALNQGQSTLVAATPERLVTLYSGQVTSDVLAGTTRRAANDTLDTWLAEDLRTSAKNRREHALVLDTVYGALAPLCSELSAPEQPEIMKLRSLQHLWSPVRGRVRPGRSLLDLAARLHPTPAVGGVPTRAALQWLAAHGETARGWYTGAMGWLTLEGDGEFAVVLRCAMLQGNHADLFAGAGIVAGSTPAGEFDEIELKLQVLLDALEDA